MKATARHLRALETTIEERLDTETSQSPLTAHDGSHALLERDAAGEQRLLVRDHDNNVLFEYCPTDARCVVSIPTGDLKLSAPRGSIELEAGEDLKLTGRTVALQGDILSSTFSRVRQTVDVLETTAGRIVERAKERFSEVEDLAQTRASHIRTIATEAFHVLGTRALIKAREELKLKGEKIHLG